VYIVAVASGEGFGPGGAGSVAAPPFAVTGPSSVPLDADRSGTASFAVSNVTGRPVRVRLFVSAVDPARGEWFTVRGDAERPLPMAGTATVDVAVRVPPEVPAGPYAFMLGAALEDAPEQAVSGPTVSFEVPPVVKRPFPWWIVIVAAVALVVLVAGGILVWILTRPDEPPPTQPAAEHEVFLAGSFTVEGGFVTPDLDTGDVSPNTPFPDVTISDTDAQVIPFNRPLDVYGVMNGVAVVVEPTYEACRDAQLSGHVSIPDSDQRAFVCTITNEDRLAVIEIPPQPNGIIEDPVSFTTWVRD
jgi:hypothetical protein